MHKMVNNLSARYYQKNTKRLQKRAGERYQNLSEEEKEESISMVANDIKTFLKMKNRLAD